MQNPYAKKDGTPINGKEFEFLDWEIEQDKERIKGLPEKQKRKEQKKSLHLRQKMES